jgi:hypothetical protein
MWRRIFSPNSGFPETGDLLYRLDFKTLAPAVVQQDITQVSHHWNSMPVPGYLSS